MNLQMVLSAKERSIAQSLAEAELAQLADDNLRSNPKPYTLKPKTLNPKKSKP